jgi:hypothetical protein
MIVCQQKQLVCILKQNPHTTLQKFCYLSNLFPECIYIYFYCQRGKKSNASVPLKKVNNIAPTPPPLQEYLSRRYPG